MFEDLVNLIAQRLAQQAEVIVAISGHGGSGKSTLAERLGRHFGVLDSQIVRMDGLYATKYMERRDLYGLHDWPALIALLSQIRNGDRLRYLKRNDKEIETTVELPKPRVVLVEGIRLIRPELLPLVDISVWIDCPLEFATDRAKGRNRQQGDSDAEIALWDTKWVPEAKLYLEQAAPDRIASFLFTQYR
jgi:uridine kinase